MALAAVLCGLTGGLVGATPAVAFGRAVPRGLPHAFGGGRLHAGASRPQGYLGIEFHNLNEDEAAAAVGRQGKGVEISMVDHDGPAGKAGLRRYDILIRLNGKAIKGADELRKMIHDAGAGASVSLAVLRGGRTLMLNAELESREDVERRAWEHVVDAGPPTEPAEGSDDVASGSADGVSPAPEGRVVHGNSFLGSVLHSGHATGLMLEAMQPQLAGYFGAPPGLGLLVGSVVPGSAAALAGLRAGDVLLRADTAVLRTTSDWTKRLHASKGHPMSLTVLRERRELTLVLQPDPKSRSTTEWPGEPPGHRGHAATAA